MNGRTRETVSPGKTRFEMGCVRLPTNTDGYVDEAEAIRMIR